MSQFDVIEAEDEIFELPEISVPNNSACAADPIVIKGSGHMTV